MRSVKHPFQITPCPEIILGSFLVPLLWVGHFSPYNEERKWIIIWMIYMGEGGEGQSKYLGRCSLWNLGIVIK